MRRDPAEGPALGEVAVGVPDLTQGVGGSDRHGQITRGGQFGQLGQGRGTSNVSGASGLDAVAP